MVNWSQILKNKDGQRFLRKFVNKEVSRDDFLKHVSINYRDVNSDIRSMVRERGVHQARSIAKKALKRRGVLA
jgi:hypothetical protein